MLWFISEENETLIRLDISHNHLRGKGMQKLVLSLAVTFYFGIVISSYARLSCDISCIFCIFLFTYVSVSETDRLEAQMKCTENKRVYFKPKLKRNCLPRLLWQSFKISWFTKKLTFFILKWKHLSVRPIFTWGKQFFTLDFRCFVHV